ncbi:MAG: hypothetical protein ACOC80_14840 [Petrotogales bacterium]
MELFDYLDGLTVDNKDLDFSDEEVNKGYPDYMINRFVSMSEIYVPVVNEINKYDVPNSTHYRYYFSILPKRKHYFKYVKKKKDLDQKEKMVIARYFEVGLKDAERYIQLLDEKQIKEILEIFSYGKNKIAGV